MREQTGVAAPGELPVVNYQRNLRAQIKARDLGAHAERERRTAHRAALLCFPDTSHDESLDGFIYFPTARCHRDRWVETVCAEEIERAY